MGKINRPIDVADGQKFVAREPPFNRTGCLVLLYVLRHAWAGEFGDPRYPDDRSRPLTPEGKKRFRKWLEHLDQRLTPRVVLSSPYVRCRETSELLIEHLARGGAAKIELQQLAELGCGARARVVAPLAAEASGGLDTILVGHMPDVALMTAEFVGENQAPPHFTKASLAAVRFDDLPALGQGDLQWFASPKASGF